MITPNTIGRIFSEVSFQDPNTRISTNAVALSAEYIRLFVREAILRADAQRKAEELPTRVDGIDNVAAGEATTEEYEQFREEDIDFDPEQRGSGVPTQLPPSDEATDTLATRHLVSITGLLVMDF